jgi:hypothetical protein
LLPEGESAAPLEDVDPIASSEIVAAADDGAQLEQNTFPIDAKAPGWTDGDEEAERTGDERDEAGKA